MRRAVNARFPATWMVLLAILPAVRPASAADEVRQADLPLPDARVPDDVVVLREASEILLKQPALHVFWIDRGLIDIGDLQIRAGDFEGALRSIRGCRYEYDRKGRLVTLAQALARNGRRERATQVLGMLDSDHGWSQDFLDDGVQLAWIEHLIARGKFEETEKAVGKLHLDGYVPEARRKLAAAHAQAGESTRAAEQFARAVDAAAKLRDDFDRARALCEIADAQGATGDIAAAKITIGRLVDGAEIKEPGERMYALREAAVVTAKAGDVPMARALFGRAIEIGESVRYSVDALETIGLAQAGVGYLDDARQTAALIRHSEEHFAHDGARERILLAIAMAQLKQDDVEGRLAPPCP
jgi:tetratricopeptide (TPR) repeat protein